MSCRLLLALKTGFLSAKNCLKYTKFKLSPVFVIEELGFLIFTYGRAEAVFLNITYKIQGPDKNLSFTTLKYISVSK